LPRSSPLSLPEGTPASGWPLYDAVLRQFPPTEQLHETPKPQPTPEESVLHQALDYARQVSRDLLKAQETIRQLRQENDTLRYLLGDRIA
jgi:hypothetical protein